MIGIKKGAIKNVLEKLLKSFEDGNNKAIKKYCIKLMQHIEHYMGSQKIRIGSSREIEKYKSWNKSALPNTTVQEEYDTDDLGKKIYDTILTIKKDADKWCNQTNPGDADVYLLNQLDQNYRSYLKSYLLSFLKSCK